MPPKRKPAAGRKPRGKLLPAQVLPIGQVLTDLTKKGWSLGAKVGMGGCGEIFLSAPLGNSITPELASHVIKIEPHGNGPLFSELAFYHRAAKTEMIKNWQAKHREVAYVGVPAYIAEGWHELDGQRWRFMVMERFGEDLEMIFTKHGRIFSLPTVCSLAINLLNSLKYLHNNEYVHADIKGANLLVGRTKAKRHEVYLVDYGLAYRYLADGKHREYQEDPRCAHDGTIEFTSRDAHKGARPSRRGDLEILGYVLVQWACGVLPWESKISKKDIVAQEKEKFMKNPELHLNNIFPPGEAPSCLLQYFSQISKLDYLQQPDYAKLRNLFLKELTSLKINPKNTSHLDWMQPSTPAKRRSISARSPIQQPAVDTRGAAERASKRASSSQSSENATPKKPKFAPSPKPKRAVSKKAVGVPLYKQGVRRSPRFDKLSISPSKGLRDRRRAAIDMQQSGPPGCQQPHSKRRSEEGPDPLTDGYAPRKRNRFEKVDDVYNFIYEDEVVVPASPVLPSPPVYTRFSPFPSPSLPTGLPTDAMQQVASNADKRKADSRKKKQSASNDSDDLEIISIDKPSKARNAKNKPVQVINDSDSLSNPTPEMIKVMNNQPRGRRKK